MNIKYLGHSAFEIETKGKKILIDPFLVAVPNYKAENIYDIINAVWIKKSEKNNLPVIDKLVEYDDSFKDIYNKSSQEIDIQNDKCLYAGIDLDGSLATQENIEKYFTDKFISLDYKYAKRYTEYKRNLKYNNMIKRSDKGKFYNDL